MNRTSTFIRKHKVFTSFLVALIFVLPLLLVHVLYKLDLNIWWLKSEWTAGDMIGYIAGFEAFIGSVSLGALALWQNQQIHKQHIESLEPTLSMRLVDLNGWLYLMIDNTGSIEAKEVRINILEIYNNGDQNTLHLDGLFHTSFELYPKESVQGEIAISGASIATKIFPQVRVSVSYLRPDLNRRKEYERTVTYSNGYDSKVIADVNYDNRTMEFDIDKIARASVRMANYLDGHQVAKFDELDLLAGCSLRNDLIDAIRSKQKKPVVNRSQAIKKRIPRKHIPYKQQEDQENA